MNIRTLLFKDSKCDICRLVQKELLDNPPNCDVTILHTKHEHDTALVTRFNVTTFPTTIIVDLDKNYELTRYEGFVNCETIDKVIKEYESKCMV